LHIDSPVAVANDRVFAGSGYQTLAAFAVNPATGQEVWKRDLPLRSFGPPLVLGKRVHYGLGTGNLTFDLSVEPEPGKPAERAPAGAVVCLDADSGAVVWQRDLDRSVHTQMSGDGRAIYAACRDGWVYALDRTSGAVLWRFNYGAPITTGTAVAAYTKLGLAAAVYATSPTGGVYAHDPLSGKVIWSREISRMAMRDAEVMAPPTVVKADADGIERHVYVPVTLTNRTTGAKTAAVAKFVDRAGE
jgi:outer membrane protein assembly factor BamB